MNATGNSTAALPVPDQTAALIANVVQAAVFFLLGPPVCIYGPAIVHIVTLIRSLFAMNYLAFINSVSSVNRMTAFSVFTDQIAVLAAGTLSMTIASLRAKRLRAYTAGAVLGTMIATPLVAVIRTQLYFGPVGCTGYGTKTVEFPEGMPIGCDHESTAFQVTYQLTKGLVVALVVGFAIVGQKTMGFSIALMGATMAVSGTMDLLETILLTAVNDQELAKTINEAFGGIELPLTYGLAGLGYFFQLMILKQKDDLRYTSPEMYCEDTEEITELKEKLKARPKPEEETSFKGFFKAIFAREKMRKKIKKQVNLNYMLNAKKPIPFRDPEVLTKQPEEMNKLPFKLFRCLISGRIDDRLHKVDNFLKNILLDDDGPAMLTAVMVAHMKVMLKKTLKKKAAEKLGGTAGKMLAESSTGDKKNKVDEPVKV